MAEGSQGHQVSDEVCSKIASCYARCWLRLPWQARTHTQHEQVHIWKQYKDTQCTYTCICVYVLVYSRYIRTDGWVYICMSASIYIYVHAWMYAHVNSLSFWGREGERRERFCHIVQLPSQHLRPKSCAHMMALSYSLLES